MLKHDSSYFYRNGSSCMSDHKYTKDFKNAIKSHGVQVGQWIWITRTSIAALSETEDYRVKVVGITRNFVVLRYPAGFNECAHWDDFDKMRRYDPGKPRQNRRRKH